MPTLARRSPAWILLLLTAIVGHFYLMAGPNGGISPSNDSVDWLLNTKNPREYRFNFPTSVNGSGNVPPIERRLLASVTNGNIASAAVIWGGASVALFSFIGVGSPPGRSGPGAFFRRPIQWLGWISRCRGRDWGALLLGAGLTMAGANVAGLNPQASLIAGATGALGVTGGWGRWTSGALYRLMPLWKGERSRTRFSMRAAHLVVAGAPIGVTASSVIDGAGWGVLIAIVGAAIFVSAFVRRSIGAMSSPAALGMIAFGVAGLITKDLAIADDGGKSEFSGGWEDFLQSQGAIEIGIHSATGTASTILGPLTPRGGEDPLPDEGGANNRVTAVSLSMARREN